MLILIGTLTHINAQTSSSSQSPELSAHTAFFEATMSEFQAYLVDAKLETVMTEGKVTVEDRLLTLTFEHAFSNDTRLKSTWTGLANLYKRLNKQSLAEDLFMQAAFIFQVDPDLLRMRIVGADNQTLRVLFDYRQGAFVFESYFPEEMQGGSLTFSPWRVPRIGALAQSNLPPDVSVEQTLEALHQFVRGQFDNAQAQFEILDHDNEAPNHQHMTILATGVTPVILPESTDALESILFHIDIEQKTAFTQIKVTLSGAQSAGLEAPGFRNMPLTPIRQVADLKAYATHFSNVMTEYLMML
ncbi:hypothetical protein [Pontibacter sp. G13]|uniref:hypothetical protein n=1 Tax=Pontibacter sp. G13 TaxID=3074898 RepID=UPI002889D587|nr:hypothetical protein [Pontibacter sp. G13]WNJ21010.1 hypothetical protein RJD25_11105 [Pontibacter sp. G13]